MKYIIATQEKQNGNHEVFFCSFSDNMVHALVFSQMISTVAHQNNDEKRKDNYTHPPLIARSAGFIDRHGRFFGESTSLGIKSGNKDQRLIHDLDLTAGSQNWKINALDVAVLWEDLSEDEASKKYVEEGLNTGSGTTSEEETPA